MSGPYSEILEGEMYLRVAPGARHEEICRRLHERAAAALAGTSAARLLASRTEITLPHGTRVCPDLALVTAANAKLVLAVEIVSPGDHHPDTVIKKMVYEQFSVPRLWMVDPRYDNVEVYHGSPHGLVLKHILAGREILTEPLLPAFQYVIAELFKA